MRSLNKWSEKKRDVSLDNNHTACIWFKIFYNKTFNTLKLLIFKHYKSIL